MRVLVVGGTNFIGPRAVRRLAGEGHEVTVFHWGRTETGLPESVKRIRGDRRRLANHADEFERLAPEVVLDMIAMSEREARDAMSAFRGIARRIVAISSGDVYRAYDVVRRREPGPPDRVPLGEDSPLREKLYPYEGEGAEEYEKILVESVVMKDPELPGTVLRLPAVYMARATTSTGCFHTSSAWTTGGPGSCSKKAWPPGAGHTGTSRTSPPL